MSALLRKRVDELRADNERLRVVLEKANAQTQRFERECDLTGDVLEKLQSVAGQVLRDMQAQGVLLEWQTLLAYAIGKQKGE